jgi:hypothetical protein
MASGIGAAQLPAALRVTHNQDGLLMGMVGPICLALWWAKPTPERFAIQRTQLHAAVAREPGKLTFSCVVSPQAEPPEDAERKASADMITSQGTKLLGVACVIEGVGFRAAITRTVLTGMLVLIRSPAPIKLFDSVRHASPFLARCLNRPSLSELDAEFERARALLSPAIRPR